ncbi:putative ThiF family [Trypanosoma vivax]|uniref:Adenylyltransferase and sulfurtransferase MOCS3 homolog n=1 Tax=Trypanosoma vivax (strain Y486) TaxID=1055687 RepID=G0UAB3_TRYVY|nr:putative molybdopterin synthase sulfurylase-like protein [Trypanosoma vivax]KAH8617986.1 putative ThiF family [Trypanosoma vivax]CCC52746.1 putative molybdopterin synthase sulphurylase-like protein [Trypanosoma vivax Y486]
MSSVAELEREVEATRCKLRELEMQLSDARERLASDNASGNQQVCSSTCAEASAAPVDGKGHSDMPIKAFVSSANSLTKDDIERFSRQMILEDIGAVGMERIRCGRVLLVGAGGLGSTIALFLAAAGVGELCIVDFDLVELSNLHRQVIHTTERVGLPKAESAARSCRALNPEIKVRTVAVPFSPANAEQLVSNFDVVVDGTDNVSARYVVNDAAARQRRPLVSGSALRWEGQLSVYCSGETVPCYRCLFPSPPPPAATGSCNNTGVAGPVPGCIGCLQALETLKLLSGAGDVLAGRMLLFDGLRMRVRIVSLRKRQINCPACGEGEMKRKHVPLHQLAAERPEYAVAPCDSGIATSARLLPEAARISPQEFHTRREQENGELKKFITLDVRTRVQFDMAHLPHSVSLPLPQLQEWKRDGVLASEWRRFISAHLSGDETEVDVFVLCRRGVTSVAATQLLLPLQHCGVEADGMHGEPPTFAGCESVHFRFMNVDGGLNAYHTQVDSDFPFY